MSESKDNTQTVEQDAIPGQFKVRLLRDCPGVDENGKGTIHKKGTVITSPRAWIMCRPFNGQPPMAEPICDGAKAKAKELAASRQLNLAALQARIDGYPRHTKGANKGKINLAKLNDAMKGQLKMAVTYNLNDTEAA